MTDRTDLPALKYSPLDSERFARRIFRATLDTIDPSALREALLQERVDTLILRVPAASVGQLARLCEVDLTAIVADTHVQYEIALPDYVASNVDQEMAFVAVDTAQAAQLRAIARAIFDGYPSHYLANPLLDVAAIADGYADWAARHVSGDKTPVWFLESAGQIVGFTACQVDVAGGTMHGVLNGILPRARGSGLYRAMLHGLLRQFRDAGFRTFAIATQAHNIAVQRVWTAAGLRLCRAENTAHINAGFGDHRQADPRTAQLTPAQR